jgi:hypothetical protein
MVSLFDISVTFHVTDPICASRTTPRRFKMMRLKNFFIKKKKAQKS